MKEQITSRAFRMYSDANRIYQFLTDIYTRDWRTGVPAPFFEYQLYSTWSDKTYNYLNRIWFDEEKIVAFVFYDEGPFNWNFCLRPGYEHLAFEMVQYVKEEIPNFHGHEKQMVFQSGQEEFIQAAKKLGYEKVGEYTDLYYDIETKKPLDAPLPEGFRFVPFEEVDFTKVAECFWKGFGHEAEKGPWKTDVSSYIVDQEWTVANQLKCVLSINEAEHLTRELAVTIENENGDYVCRAEMWWTKENQLAYLEPLCTVPEYQKKGLAAAALSELYRRTKKLGATHMTGGADAFYKKMGFTKAHTWTFWKLKK